MENLVYISRNEKGLYVKDKGRFYFTDRSFEGATEGFAYVKIIKEKESYGFITGSMVKPSKIDLDRRGADLYRLGGSYWSTSEVNGVDVAWCYSGDVLNVYIDGVGYTDWGYEEYNIYQALLGKPNKVVYTMGYWLKSMAEGTNDNVSIDKVLACSGWNKGRKDDLYVFGGKIYMFDPMSGCMTNYGVVYNGVYRNLDCIETVDMWEFLCREYSDSKVKCE